ncbi:hypothetical protein DYB32_008524 [Aphanomyces invadans]|uniref:ATPase AAA-type core domain-containing protein n=1 Tax=Aphanomyces invadans TaxID=157072 RepID=A0A418AKS7_9STRA|nr:hypothetical protein DYB32_008524 [Aphanomyces invadans]
MISLSHVDIELLSPFPRVLVPSRKRATVPQVVRDNKLHFENAVVRQLRLVAKDHLFSIALMGQLYIGRVVAAVGEAGQPVPMGAIMSTTTVFLHMDYPSSSLDQTARDWKAVWDAYPWQERMLLAGLAGYNALVDHIVLHLRLALSLDKPSITSHGFLVQGVGGVGKTLLLEALRQQLVALHVPVVLADSHTLRLEADTSTAFPSTSQFLAHSLRSLEASSNNHQHGVFLLDNVNALVEDDGTISALGRSLLQILDQWTEQGRPLAVVATASMKALPSSLTRTGRLERQLLMEVPTEAMRAAIADRLLHDTVLAAALASATGGYVGKDLSKIVRHATAMAKLKGLAAPTWLELLKVRGAAHCWKINKSIK